MQLQPNTALFLFPKQNDGMIAYESASLHNKLKQANKLGDSECMRLSDEDVADAHNMPMVVSSLHPQ